MQIILKKIKNKSTFYILVNIFILLFSNNLVSAQEKLREPIYVYESQSDSSNLVSDFFDISDILSSLFAPDTLSSVILHSNDSLNLAFGGEWSNDILFLFNKESDISKMEDSILIILKDEKNLFSSPKEGPINSDFGWRRRRFHYGIDIDLNIGDTVKSTFDGIVRVSKWVSGYGNVIIVRHFNGLETLYGHLTCSKVLPNQEVKAGELIGLGGSTGRSTGPHLHYEIRYKGSPLNPNQLINFKTAALVKDSIYLSKKSFKYISDIKKAATTTKYYKVKPGDSLSKIAVKNGTSVSNLCRLNGIKQTSTLAVGRTLRVK